MMHSTGSGPTDRILSDLAWQGSVHAGEVLQGVRIVGGNLARTDFRGADLREACFSKVDCRGAVFTGAQLGRAQFTQCLLSRSVLQSCWLEGAQFVECDLADSDFRGSRMPLSLLSLSDRSEERRV